MNKIIKSLLLAAALVVPAQKVLAFSRADCDAIIRMSFGAVMGVGFYQVIEGLACNFWDLESVQSEASAGSIAEYRKALHDSQTKVVQKTLAQKLLKLGKNCGKTALALALGYAIMYNSFTDLVLTGWYDDMQALLKSERFTTLVVPNGATTLQVPCYNPIVFS